jgi:hypothetical protein
LSIRLAEEKRLGAVMRRDAYEAKANEDSVADALRVVAS